MLLIFGKKTGTSRTLLALVLRERFGITVLPRIANTSLGKPYFPDFPEIQFSLSHSGNLMLCALGGFPVGADIEIIKPRQAGLPRYALTAPEYDRYLKTGGDWPAFYDLWTQKEAWCKYTGRGLLDRQTDLPSTGLYLGAYAGDTWRAAVCAEEIPPKEILWFD